MSAKRKIPRLRLNESEAEEADRKRRRTKRLMRIMAAYIRRHPRQFGLEPGPMRFTFDDK